MHRMSAYIGYETHVSGILVSIAVPGISCSYMVGEDMSFVAHNPQSNLPGKHTSHTSPNLQLSQLHHAISEKLEVSNA